MSRRKQRILFVCLGNICRSPIAEGVAAKQIAKKKLEMEVDSAGTSSWHEGEHPCRHSVTIAGRNGVDISQQRSRPIQKEDIEYFDHVVAMDEQNREDLLDFGFTNVHKLGDYGGFDGADVPDPYFFPGFEGFEKVYSMISLAMHDLLETIEGH